MIPKGVEAYYLDDQIRNAPGIWIRQVEWIEALADVRGWTTSPSLGVRFALTDQGPGDL